MSANKLTLNRTKTEYMTIGSKKRVKHIDTEPCLHIKDREINTRNSKFNFALPQPKTNYMKKAFAYRRAETWNNLPANLKSKTSISTFKNNLPILIELYRIRTLL